MFLSLVTVKWIETELMAKLAHLTMCIRTGIVTATSTFHEKGTKRGRVFVLRPFNRLQSVGVDDICIRFGRITVFEFFFRHKNGSLRVEKAVAIVIDYV